MKYPVYPEYKPSGVEWLGQVPKDWNSASLKWLSRRYSGGTPDKSNDTYWEDGTIPWLNSGAVNDGYIIEPSTYITCEGFLNSSAKWIPKDALVMALAGQGKTKGMVAQLGIRTTCNQSMAAIIPDHRLLPRFLYYWLASNYQNIRNLAGGEQRDGLNLDILGSITCPLVPLPNQIAIASFLDRETGCIDKLVAKNHQLTERLKEQRVALITRTVTRGLPADTAGEYGVEHHTRFKDSGIAWLGAIPGKWQILPIWQLYFLGRGRVISHEDIRETPGIYPVYSSQTENNGILGYLGTNDFDGDYVTWTTDGANAGTAFRRTGKFNCTNVCGTLRPKDTRMIDNSFTTHALNIANAEYVRHDINPKLMNNVIAKIKIGVPDISEQIAIISFLDLEIQKIDKLIEKVELTIERLKEYRTALITAAVTGKIDVREAK